MKELNYLDFINKINQYQQRKPLYGQIELTYRCSYNCIHCYCKNEPKVELEGCFWKDVIRQIFDLGGIELTFTGGDPLVYQDFLEVYKFARDLGFLVTIFTYGYNFTSELLDFLEVNPPLSIEITLNSLERENYEEITQTKDSFRKVMDNIYELKRRDLPLVLKCNGLKENKHEILKIKKFTEDLLGKKRFKFDSLIIPGLNGQLEPTKHRLSAEEIIEIEKQDKDMLEQRQEQLKRQTPFFNPDGLYHCNSWYGQYYINPVGILQFCHLTQKYSTDLKQEPFKQGFDKFRNTLKEKYKTNSKCVNCELKERCYHCPSRAFLEAGNEEAPVPYYCQLAKARKNFMAQIQEPSLKL